MHKRLRILTIALCGAILAACSSQQTVTPANGTPPLGSMASTAHNLVVDGIPVHALFPRGHHRHQRASCKSNCNNMIYHGGPIQKNPKIYVVYWGFTGSAADPQGVAAYEDSFLKGLSGNSYFDIVTQYYSTAAGNITDPKGEYAGSWVDNATIPHQPSSSQIAAEAVRAAGHFGYNYDAVYVVQLAHGAFKNLSYCAYHSVTSSSSGDVHYADIPYQPDFPGCGTDSVNSGTQGQNDGTSETVAHEIGETQTDPDVRTGWFDASGNEIGDYCAYINLQNYTFSTGTFAIQPLWSNAANYCAVTYP